MTGNTTTTITMPDLGEDVTEVVVSRWLAAAGEHVDAGSALVEVSTDKVDTEIPAPFDGTLVEILIAENQPCAVGAALAIIDRTDAPSPETGSAATEPAQPEVKLYPRDETDPDQSPPAALDTPAAQPLPRIRRIIARRMLESLRSTAQLTSVVEVDMTAITELRRASKEKFRHHTGVSLSYLPFLAKATIDTLLHHPLLSATVDDECTEITYHQGVHLCVAVDSPKGLMVPVIHDAQTLSIAELAARIHSAAEQVRAATITPDHLSGGTFTMTNTGSRGALFDTPILNPPQPAILGTGAIVDRLVPLGGHDRLTIGVRSMMYLALTYDHRVIDGADAARFLSDLKARLETGYRPADVTPE